MTEEKLKLELERAYRCIRGLYGAIANNRALPPTALAYHSMTIAAAIRFVDEHALDGADYFVGKKVDELHRVLELARSGGSAKHHKASAPLPERDPRDPGGTHC